MAAPEAEAELDARLRSAADRRQRAETEREQLRATAAQLRRYVPVEGHDDLVRQLRLEVSRRQQVEAEFRHVKSRLDDIAERIGRLQDAPAPKPLAPAEYRWRARGAKVLPPGEKMDQALDEITRSAHSLTEKLPARPAALEVEE